MNFRIQKKIVINTFQYNFYRSFSIQKNIGNYRNTSCSSIFYKKNAEHFSCLPFSKHFPKTILCNTSKLVSIQRRNLSSDVSDIQSPDKMTPDLLPSEETVNSTISILPNILKQISESKIVEFAQDILLKVHDTTGLPWWASIALTAFIARTIVTLPLTLIQIQTIAKLEKNKLEMDNIVKRLKSEANHHYKMGWPENVVKIDLRKKIKKEMNNLIVRDNCHPAKCYIVVYLQIPLWIAFSFATRNLCSMLPHQDIASKITYLQMTVGGFGWIKNLVDVDHYMILPLISGLINLTVLEVHQLFRSRPDTKFEKWIRIFIKTFIIITIPIAAHLPVAINCYWISSSIYGLMQVFLINSTRLRRLFRVPVVESQLKHPYQHFYNNFKAKLTNK